jgi:putative ABC transport system substrate-binding protein
MSNSAVEVRTFISSAGRREFSSAVAAALMTAFFPVRAQNLREHRIGCLLPLQRSANLDSYSIVVMVEGLRALGWAEGRNLTIEYREAKGQPELFGQLARELVALNVELIVAVTGNAATAAKNATSSIPIVMVAAPDPVKFGLVASLARPGGNVTGLALPTIEWGKWLELAQQAIPSLSRISVIANPDNRVYADYAAQNQEAAKRLGLRLQMLPVGRAEQFDEAFSSMKREKADALVFGPDSLYRSHMKEIIDSASAARLPVIGPDRQAAELGALAGYGYDVRNAWQRIPAYVNRILRGAKPSDLPVEQPDKFELVVNLRTAHALGLSIPQPVLVRADEVLG